MESPGVEALRATRRHGGVRVVRVRKSRWSGEGTRWHVVIGDVTH